MTKLTTRPVRRLRSAHGFSLVDIMVVVALSGLLAGMATLQIGAVRPGMQGDGAMRIVMGELNAAREMAITQRRYMSVSFVNGNAVRITRFDVPAGTTVLREVTFESGVRFGLIGGVGDTPDNFGNTVPVTFGSTQIMFTTDGTLVNEAGSPVNGSIFLVIPDQPLSFRAVTVMGATGRVRGYRWNGAAWGRV